MITPQNILLHEFVGLETKIIESTNLQIIGLNGKIIEDTKSMFSIETTDGTKKIPKRHSKWRFSLQDSHVDLEGEKISKRPQDRLRGKL